MRWENDEENMLSTLIAATALAIAPPVDFQLKYKVGEKFAFVHRMQSSFADLDATGEVVLTVTEAANGRFKFSHPAINYRSTGKINPSPMTAGTVHLTGKGHYIGVKMGDTAPALFPFCPLPPEPISVGESYTADVKMPDGIVVKFKGKFQRLSGPSKNLASLVLDGDMMQGSQSRAKVNVSITFDVQKGIYVLIVANMMEGLSIATLKLKQ